MDSKESTRIYYKTSDAIEAVERFIENTDDPQAIAMLESIKAYLDQILYLSSSFTIECAFCGIQTNASQRENFPEDWTHYAWYCHPTGEDTFVDHICPKCSAEHLVYDQEIMEMLVIPEHVKELRIFKGTV